MAMESSVEGAGKKRPRKQSKLAFSSGGLEAKRRSLVSSDGFCGAFELERPGELEDVEKRRLRAEIFCEIPVSCPKPVFCDDSGLELPPGVHLFRGFLSEVEQAGLVRVFDSIAKELPPTLEETNISGNVGYMRAFLTYVGRRREDKVSSGSIPVELLSLFGRILSHEFPDIPKPPDAPDVALFNYYPRHWGKLGLHRDKDERDATIKKGYPVVSISLGDTAEFELRIPPSLDEWKPSEKYPKIDRIPKASEARTLKIPLHSGDVIIFGGPARLIPHGIRQIQKTRPWNIPMHPGRINITLRNY